MPDGVVSRLHLRVPSGLVNTARARIEDALARAATDERLLLLRRLDLGRLPIRSPATYWADRTEEKIATASRRAVHGSAPGAAGADAVWFHSAEEAWSLLLRELALGRTPSAWFWRLVVPDWKNAPLSVWLPRLTRLAVREPEMMVRLAHALRPVFGAGVWASVLAALADAPSPVMRLGRPDRPVAGEFPGAATLGWADQAARRALARLDRGTRATAAAAVRAVPPSDARRDWIALLVLLPLAPELAGTPTTLAATTAAFATLLTGSLIDLSSGRSDGTSFSGSPLDDHPQTRPAEGGDNRENRVPTAGEDPGSRDVREPRPMQGSDLVPTDRRRASETPPAAPAAHAEPVLVPAAALSPVAGLFLLIRPLILLDFPAWQARHEARTIEGFGRHLLRDIARRMGCPPDDPVLGVLGPDAPDDLATPRDQGPESPALNAAVTAWRVGLDRWLRRTVRITLSETVRRQGWVLADGERVSVRFRLDSADIRLRRRALDIDPGWVPFLGLVVRYVYRDEPDADRKAPWR